jgi:hypothetical protein
MTPMKTLRHLLITALLLPAITCAADPAKTMFDVELGTRFQYPACARGEDTMTKRHCYAEALTAKTTWGTEQYHLFYPHTSSTPWARGEMMVEVAKGIIVAIHVNTWGIQGQGTALETLTKKYGPPARSRSETIKGHRSRYPSKFAEWDMKDFSVKLDGTTSTIDWGRITLASTAYQKIRKDKHE